MRACVTNVKMSNTGASALLRLDGHKVPISVVLRPADIAKAKQVAARWLTKYRKKLMAFALRHHQDRISGGGEVEIGFFKKLFKKVKHAVKKVTPKFVKKAVKKAMNTKLGRFAVKKAKQLMRFAKKVGKTVKKIVQHPAFQATVFAVSQIVPGAQALGVVYIAAMTAIKVAEGLAKGDPKALVALGKYATDAARGDPAAAEVMGRFDSIKAIASAKSPLDAIQKSTGVIKQIPGIGEMSREMDMALKVASGLGRKDPNAISAIKGYANAASKGNPVAANVVTQFKKIKAMGKVPPDIKRMLDAVANKPKPAAA